MKVYVVTEGSYSDYSIVAVFSTMKKAQDFIALDDSKNLDCPDVEIYDVDPYEVELGAGCVPMLVTMKRNGDVKRVERTMSMGHFSDMGNVYNLGTGGEFIVLVWAKDEKGAIKVANEKRVQHIAEFGWVQRYEVE